MIKRLAFLIMILAMGGSCCHFAVGEGGRRPQVIETDCDDPEDYNIPCEPECRDPCRNYHDPVLPLRDVLPEELVPKPFSIADYKVRAGDVFDVNVYGEEDITLVSAVVAEDGKIYYSILEGIPAEGRTVQDIVDELETRFRKYYLDPRITVTPKIITGLSWRVLGRVMKAGYYPLRSPITLKAAIGEAGGLAIQTTQFKNQERRIKTSADLSKSFLVRDGYRLNIDFEKVLFTADNSQNVYIQPGDYIYLWPKENLFIFLVGNTRDPRRVNYFDGITLAHVIASAGGWDSGSANSPNLNKAIIVRGSLCNPKVICADFEKILRGAARDVYLCSGDIVYLTNKPFRFVREVTRLAIESYVAGFTVTAGQFYSSEVVPLPNIINEN
jgi:polysaccharide export outer membrane protein